MIGIPKLKRVALGIVLGYTGHAAFAGTTVSFYAKDQHGSIAGATDTNGNLTATALNQYNDYGVNQSSASSNNQAKIGISYDPYQYSGEYTDNESGLQPLGNGYRYYNSSLMRFISPDSYPLLNLYAYGNGNPIMNVDPTGHIVVGEGIGDGIELVAGGVLDALFPEVGLGDPLLVAGIDGAIQGGAADAEAAEDVAATAEQIGVKRAAESSLSDEEPAAKVPRTEEPWQTNPSTFRNLPQELNTQVAGTLNLQSAKNLTLASKDTQAVFDPIFNYLIDRSIMIEDQAITGDEETFVAQMHELLEANPNEIGELQNMYDDNENDLESDYVSQNFRPLGQQIRQAYTETYPGSSMNDLLRNLPYLLRQAIPPEQEALSNMLEYSAYSDIHLGLGLGQEDWPDAETLAAFNDAYENVGGLGIEPPGDSDVSDDEP